MTEHGVTHPREALSGEEWKAIREYDAWVEEELGRRTTRLAKLFLGIGIAATVIIAATLLWWAGATKNSPKGEGVSAAGVGPQEEAPGEKAKTGGAYRVRLVYRVPGDPDASTVVEVARVLRLRVQKLELPLSELLAIPDDDEVHVLLPAVTAAQLDLVKRTLVSPGQLVFAIEATPAELADPTSGLGSEFDVEQFIREQTQAAERRRKENPQRYGEFYTGESVPLYRNTKDFLVPKTPEQKPTFADHPPLRWRPETSQGADERIRGPSSGALVFLGEDRVFTGADFAKCYPTTTRFERVVVGFEFKKDVKPRFSEFTRKYRKRNLCIIFNGRLLTRPIIQSVLPGSGIIQGVGDRADVKMLIATVNAGALKVKPILVREETIATGR